MKTKFIFILANASLELIPKTLWRDKPIKRWARFRKKRPGELVLDSTLHSPSIKKLSSSRDRGRPDILHRALLIITDSILNKEGLVDSIIIHTIGGEVFWVNPIIRPPRHYIRFLGLMEKLLREGTIVTSNGAILIKKIDSLESYLRERDGIFLIALSRDGEKMKITDILPTLLEDTYSRIAIAVGALPHGGLPKLIIKNADLKLSLGDYNLSTTYVLCRIISRIENYLEL